MSDFNEMFIDVDSYLPPRIREQVELLETVEQFADVNSVPVGDECVQYIKLDTLKEFLEQKRVSLKKKKK